MLQGGIVSPEDGLEVIQVKNHLRPRATSRPKSSALEFNYTETQQSLEDRGPSRPPQVIAAKETSARETEQCPRRPQSQNHNGCIVDTHQRRDRLHSAEKRALSKSHTVHSLSQLRSENNLEEL